MRESGEAEFQLVFPPLSDNATSFDFTEGEKGGKRIQRLGNTTEKQETAGTGTSPERRSTQSRP